MKILTVEKLIDYLQTNFKPTDKLCFWYEGGAYMNCEHVLEDMLGDNMFIKVKQDKDRMKNRFINMTDDEINEDYRNVDDNDVIVH
jgi:hypothetical protein